MIERLIALIVVATFAQGACAAGVDERIDLPTCTLHARVVHGAAGPQSPHFIMVDGVPLSAAIYLGLAERLSARLGATSLLVDFPGVGGSRLKGPYYGWAPMRECLHAYLKVQPPYVLVLSDLALPLAAPLLPALPNLRGVVILNSVIRPSEFHPPFPMNFLRCCPHLAVAVGSIMPRALYEKRIRDVGLGRPQAVNPEEIHALYAEMRRDHGLRRLARIMNDITLDTDGDREILAGLATTVPQLLVWGAADPALGGEYKKLPSLTVNQQLVVLPQARHFLMLDFADEVADALVEWYGHQPGTTRQSRSCRGYTER